MLIKKTGTVLIFVNHDIVIYNFRKELVQRLINEGYKVIISSPYGERIDSLIHMGCQFINTHIDRHGKNFINEGKLLLFYLSVIKKENPSIVLTYTIKPNIYGGLVCQILGIPYIANITGLGSALYQNPLAHNFVFLLYKCALKKGYCVFFQNTENLNFFISHKFNEKKTRLINGSGVNLREYYPLEYPEGRSKDVTANIEFVFISRIMKEKGIDEYLEAAKLIHQNYPFVKFHICGFCEEGYEDILAKQMEQNLIIYHGMVKDIRKILKQIHCTVLPSYHEGMSNALLESAACSRPIITSDISGCREILEDGVTGYLCRPKDSKDLANKIESFLKLSLDDMRNMGIQGRKRMERYFDRDDIIESYMMELKSCLQNKK